MDLTALLENLDMAHEGQRLEFKEAGAGLPDDLWETYSAFANTEGGKIVLGVSEDRALKRFSAEGVADAQGIIADFWSTLRNPQKVSHDIMLYDGVSAKRAESKDFVVINVPKAERGDKPVRVYDRRSKRLVAWIRREDGDYKASEEDVRLMQYDGIPSADRKPIDNFTPDALNRETIRRYRSVFASNKPQNPWVDDSDEDFLYHIGALAKGHDGALHPSRAGLLAFGQEYETTNYIPHYLLDYREEISTDRRWDDRVVSQSGDWSGNLIDFYYLVSERLVRHFKMPFSTDSTGMVHGSQNPITEAANEALANALVHAYYGAHGSVRVILKNDRLEVSNPGSLLVDWRVAVAGGFSETRNPTLMRIFSFIGASDRAGSGLQQIWETWETVYNEPPSISETHSPASVSLLLPLREKGAYAPGRRESQATRETIDDDSLKKILVSSTRGLTPQELHEATGISRRSAQERLKLLYDKGFISREKEGRFYRYQSIEH